MSPHVHGYAVSLPPEGAPALSERSFESEHAKTH
jgi:hypothetical protein